MVIFLHTKPVLILLTCEELACNNLEVQKGADGVTLSSVGGDAHVIRLFRQYLEQNYLESLKSLQYGYSVKLIFQHPVPGPLPCIIRWIQRRTFQGNIVKTIAFEDGTTNTITLEIEAIPYDLRIDVDTEEIVLNAIRVMPQIGMIDEKDEASETELGYIPLLWAEEDEDMDCEALPVVLDLTQDMIQDAEKYLVSIDDSVGRRPVYGLFAG